ncbi:hypothetical protein RJT34_03209 [Clitoria ternatea]|uniref:Uncharacterized protein n=1 Tax=Clitoria ternatea TaxID=43366 RepID=A0AAN9KJE8_CLITE
MCRHCHLLAPLTTASPYQLPLCCHGASASYGSASASTVHHSPRLTVKASPHRLHLRLRSLGAATARQGDDVTDNDINGWNCCYISEKSSNSTFELGCDFLSICGPQAQCAWESECELLSLNSGDTVLASDDAALAPLTLNIPPVTLQQLQ